jgi:hypothetical protein
MSIVHLSYVVCDECYTPASDPVDPGQARAMIPTSWSRERRSGRNVDLCPEHRSDTLLNVMKGLSDSDA